jgi:hypothetical protein
METIESLISAISSANPLVLVTIISVVALYVVLECVKHLSKGDK